MKRKELWKILLISAAILLVFPVAPEIGLLVFLVDALSIDVILLLFEIQLTLFVGTMYHQGVRPVLLWVNTAIERLDAFYFVPSRDMLRRFPPAIFHAVPFLVSCYLVVFLGMSAYL